LNLLPVKHTEVHTFVAGKRPTKAIMSDMAAMQETNFAALSASGKSSRLRDLDKSCTAFGAESHRYG